MAKKKTREPAKSEQPASLLSEQNTALHEQVKQLVKMERQLYRSQNELDRQIFRINLLNEFSLSADPTRDPHIILQLALDMINNACWLDQGVGFLRSPAGRLKLAGSTGHNAATARALAQTEWVMPMQGISALKSPVVLGMPDLTDQPEEVRELVEHLEKTFQDHMRDGITHIRGEINMVLPLFHHEKPFGFMVLRKIDARSFSYHETPPSDKDLPFIQAVLSHLESALQNAFLHQEITSFASQLEVKVDERTRDLQRANEELRSTQERVIRSEKLAAVGQIAAGVAHELRNPLGAITNAVFYVRDALKEVPGADNDGSIAEMLEVMDKEIQGMARIIGDLLSYSRIIQLNKRKTDINFTVHATLKQVEKPQNVVMEEKYAPNVPQAEMDSERLGQVILNLCMNAFQAMEEGGKLTVTTRLSQNKDGAQEFLMDFTDTGSGIEPQNMSKIFDPLFTTKAKGTGLGLTICQGIVEAHGGHIEVQSKPGIGSTFTVKLPL